ncbi:MAG TPA: flavodoxin-dependent (E)-4-hydroxy-3-methylbut-2-enyl-diphosphate synthase [Candidatus Latescibacteria bacterium]|nr:flavodoxin-dependent (E)-4-hydroxy-3-methylbut-2-enyl-diphosphate synthase [Candidatus Latescibacterota bacterium]HQK22483.1 flavodoxin-dependent (E)-4-hydroxy-3-methylbut-2-enyl-diphosphate synthase [Candidatus Latescibacterota bacterium]
MAHETPGSAGLGNDTSSHVKPLTLRTATRRVSVGGVQIGGGAPVTVQSMCTTNTRDIDATVRQIHALADAGCEIVRVAVPHEADARALGEIRRQIPIPLVADIHFGHRLALVAVEQGVDKLRINPGNIGTRQSVERVASACSERGIPIRIGVNAGSLEKDILEKFGYPTAAGLVESALRHVRILEDLSFYDIVVSLKASDVPMAIAAYTDFSRERPYPLHVGITEAGTAKTGTIASAVGIGAILSAGIGDTIRVSLTDDPVKEVAVGFDILKSLRLRVKGPTLISCPTCGRVEIDLIRIAQEVERRLEKYSESFRVAVMGCVVNGPGESQGADFGIAGGKGVGLVYRDGAVVRRVKEEELVAALFEEIEKARAEGRVS